MTDKTGLLEIIDNFASKYQRKSYKGKFIGKKILKEIAWNFVNYVENMNELPIVFIDIFKKSFKNLGTDPEKIKELEESIRKLKEGQYSEKVENLGKEIKQLKRKRKKS